MIFYVEDDNSIRELVLYTLRNSGLEAEGFTSGKEFFTTIKKTMPSLVLLDIMLPDEDGIEILKKLREDTATRKVPVIMVTAKGTEYDKVIGLDLGADDYISKPFGMMELVSRVKAVLRRTVGEDNSKIYSYENVKMNLKSHVVTVSGESIDLTYKEFELLHLLMENTGNVVTRTMILEKIWGYDIVDVTRTVDVHIRTLRRKLGENGAIIQTVKGVGYRVGGGRA